MIVLTLREILKANGIPYKTVSDALGIHPNNMPRYDDLMKRSLEEILIISKVTGIDISYLIGLNVTLANDEKTESVESRLISIIESQQRTIENLTNK